MLTSFTTNVLAEDVYYCIDDSVVGFDYSSNNEVARFNEIKFTLKVDIENERLASDKILIFDNPLVTSCSFENSITGVEHITCVNYSGSAIQLNLNNMSYIRTIFSTLGDDTFIAHGFCEKF